jgi:hypothetical protein
MNNKCPSCGKEHDGLPDVGSDKPDYYWEIPEGEREKRIKLSSETCVVDDEHFFIRGVIEIPLTDKDDTFGIGVWVSQKREYFKKYLDNFDTSNIGPFFGWLSTNIGYFHESSLSLKTMVHFQGNNLRPLIKLEPTQHPLAIAQQRGISFAKACEIVHYYSDDRSKDA